MTDKHAKVNSCSYNSWNNQANRPIMPTSGYRERERPIMPTSGYRERERPIMPIWTYNNVMQWLKELYNNTHAIETTSLLLLVGEEQQVWITPGPTRCLLTWGPVHFHPTYWKVCMLLLCFFMSLDGVPVHCKGGVIWLHWLTGDWLLGSQPGPHAWYESSVNPHQPGNKQSQVNPSKHQTLSSVLRPHQHIGHMSPIRHQSLVTSPWPAKGPGIYAGLR